jgi:WXXGXW repeat (2 copies)
MKLMSAKLAVASVLLGGVLSACVVAPAPGYYGAVAYSAPPPAPYEVVGVAPAPGYFWIGGSWFWDGGRYAWRHGYWERPRPGYTWVPHTWHHGNNGWHEQPGHWARHG